MVDGFPINPSVMLVTHHSRYVRPRDGYFNRLTKTNDSVLFANSKGQRELYIISRLKSNDFFVLRVWGVKLFKPSKKIKDPTE